MKIIIIRTLFKWHCTLQYDNRNYKSIPPLPMFGIGSTLHKPQKLDKYLGRFNEEEEKEYIKI